MNASSVPPAAAASSYPQEDSMELQYMLPALNPTTWTSRSDYIASIERIVQRAEEKKKKNRKQSSDKHHHKHHDEDEEEKAEEEERENIFVASTTAASDGSDGSELAGASITTFPAATPAPGYPTPEQIEKFHWKFDKSSRKQTIDHEVMWKLATMQQDSTFNAKIRFRRVIFGPGSGENDIGLKTESDYKYMVATSPVDANEANQLWEQQKQHQYCGISPDILASTSNAFAPAKSAPKTDVKYEINYHFTPQLLRRGYISWQRSSKIENYYTKKNATIVPTFDTISDALPLFPEAARVFGPSETPSSPLRETRNYCSHSSEYDCEFLGFPSTCSISFEYLDCTSVFDDTALPNMAAFEFKMKKMVERVMDAGVPAMSSSNSSNSSTTEGGEISAESTSASSNTLVNMNIIADFAGWVM